MMENTGMLELLTESQALIQRLTHKIEELAPAAEIGQVVLDDGRHYGMKEVADLLSEKLGEHKVGRNKMYGLLRDIGILCSSESSWNQPYRNLIDQGYFFTKLKDTAAGPKVVTLATGKGLNFIYKKVTEYIDANNVEL